MAEPLEGSFEGLHLTEVLESQPDLKTFVCIGKLGKGGFATVWHFFDPEHGREFALKRMTLLTGTDDVTSVIFAIQCKVGCVRFPSDVHQEILL